MRFTPRLPTSSVEMLEERIAPATLLPGGKIATFTDIDGDVVTVKFSKPVLTPGNVATIFQFTGSVFTDSGSQQLGTLNVSGLGATANGVDISITARRSAVTGGNGAVDLAGLNGSNVNFANGTGAGIDLGKVTVQGNLNSIDAGDTNLDTLAIKSLDVLTIGAVSDGVKSDIFGSVGTFKVRSDLHGYINVGATPGNEAKAGIKIFTVGGSVGPGFDGEDAGHVVVAGSIGTATIGHDLNGGIMNRCGYLQVGQNLTQLTIGGSILGGSGLLTGCVFVTGTVGKITVKGDLAGGSSPLSGVLTGESIGTVTIGGSVRGYSEPTMHFQQGVASIGAKKSIGTVMIGGSLIAGNITVGIAPGADSQYGNADDSDNDAGTIATIGKIIIKGTVNGTTANTDSFGIEANKILMVKVGAVTYTPADPLLSFSTGVFLSPTGDVKLRTL